VNVSHLASILQAWCICRACGAACTSSCNWTCTRFWGTCAWVCICVRARVYVCAFVCMYKCACVCVCMHEYVSEPAWLHKCHAPTFFWPSPLKSDTCKARASIPPFPRPPLHGLRVIQVLCEGMPGFVGQGHSWHGGQGNHSQGVWARTW